MSYTQRNAKVKTMPRRVRTHITADTPDEQRLVPKHLVKQEFGRRLYSRMIAKGWYQSELSRQSGLPRDSISTYIRGRSLPTPQSLQKLATALGVQPEALLPNQIEGAIDEDTPAFEMRVSPNAPDAAWLRINRLVSLTTALKIGELLREDDALDGSGSGEAS